MQHVISRRESRLPRSPPAGSPDLRLESRSRRTRAPCFTCFMWPRSSVANSFNRNLAPGQGPECPRVYDAIAAFT